MSSDGLPASGGPAPEPVTDPPPPGAGPLATVGTFVGQLLRKIADEDSLFLASGVAFNILLAGVPFFLLLASALGYAVGTAEHDSGSAVAVFIRDLFPTTTPGGPSVLDPVLNDVVRTRGAAGAVGGVAFVWFSTRLFGSLRAVFSRVFEVARGRNIILGKLYDVGLTLAATGLVVAWIGASAYFGLARSRGVALLADAGVNSGAVMGSVTYAAGRAVTFGILIAIFYAVYRFVPFRVVRWQQALVGAVTSAALFEAARWAFAFVLGRWNPATLYTGTLAAVVIVVFWVYYAALIVIVGGQASQVWERMRGGRTRPG